MYNNRTGVIFDLSRLLKEGADILFEPGVECIQLCSWDTSLSTKENAARVKELLQDKIAVSSIWGGWSGGGTWDFVEGPITLGIVPEVFRMQRIADLKAHADFAAEVGAPYMATHMGFMPE